jgi:hypothetical protein
MISISDWERIVVGADLDTILASLEGTEEPHENTSRTACVQT